MRPPCAARQVIRSRKISSAEAPSAALAADRLDRPADQDHLHAAKPTIATLRVRFVAVNGDAGLAPLQAWPGRSSREYVAPPWQHRSLFQRLLLIGNDQVGIEHQLLAQSMADRARAERRVERERAGLEVVGAPQRWVVSANWKLGADNFIGDA